MCVKKKKIGKKKLNIIIKGLQKLCANSSLCSIPCFRTRLSQGVILLAEIQATYRGNHDKETIKNSRGRTLE